MTAILRETLTGVHVEAHHLDADPITGQAPWLLATVRVLGRRWTASVTVLRLEEHMAGARWWAWAEGRLHDGDEHDTQLVGARVGPVGMPSRRGAARSAIVEALSRLQCCAWGMVALVVPDGVEPEFIDPPAEVQL